MRSILIGFFILFPMFSLEAQIDSSDISSYHKNFFLSFFFPKGIAEGVALRSYLRSLNWKDFLNNHSDRESLDEIYEDADELCEANKTASILATSIAVLDHKTIPLKLIFGITLPIPLTLENQEDFSSRIANLPSHIYNPLISDVDKLQHFFFSAYLRQTLKMNWLVRLLGSGLEIGEGLFVEGGENDVRDRHANENGIHFGESYEEESLPSEFLTPNP
jgi:hypothetical protein